MGSPVKENNSHAILQLLEESLGFEEEAVKLYTQLANLAASLEDVALEEMARTFVQNETEHVDEVRKMLRSPDAP